MVRIKKEVYESAKRLAIRDAGGLKVLTGNVVSCMNTGSIRAGAYKYVQEDIMVYTQDRHKWLYARGLIKEAPNERVSSDKVNTLFNRIVGDAVYDAVEQYMVKHGLGITKRGYGFAIVKTGPMKRKTAKKR